MAKSIPALVTPALLKWARESAGYDVRQAMQKTGHSEERILSWEEGADQPSVAQARALARVYKRPFAVFFLDEPPREFSVLRDFRRLPESVSADFSPELRFLIRDAEARQEWASDLLQAEGAAPFRPPAPKPATPLDAARRVAKLLKCDAADHPAWPSRDQALKWWIERVEAAGIFVFQAGEVEPEEARGFALLDAFAPFIFLNSKDSRAGRIFTLIHEVVHLLIGEPGVSNLLPVHAPRGPADRIEVFCNAAAGEVLVPTSKLQEILRDEDLTTDALVEMISHKFRISTEVAARRLLSVGRITPAAYEGLRETYQQQYQAEQAKQKEKGGGPKYAVMVLQKNGTAFVRLALEAQASGRATARDVSRLLNVKLDHLAKVAAAASGV